MKRVYVAGAYSDNNVISVLKNIGRGEHYAQAVFKSGLAPFTPWHDKTFVIQNWSDTFDVKQFYDYSLAWLDVSDAVFVIPNHNGLKDWQQSKGTLAEIKRAEELNIPVFFTLTKLIKWAKN